MPSVVVGVAFEEGRNIFMDTSSGLHIHRLVCFGGDAIQTRAFSIFQFVDGSVNFFKGDRGVNLVKSWALGDVIKDGRVNWAVVVENSFKVRSKYWCDEN